MNTTPARAMTAPTGDHADAQTFERDPLRFARERDAIRGLGYDEVASGEGLSVLRRR